MEFGVIVGNPPYRGHWDPEYMGVAKAAYDRCLAAGGLMVLITPTSVVDNMLSGDPHFERLYGKYSYMALSRLEYCGAMSDVFPDIDYEGGVGIFVYSRGGAFGLFSDRVREAICGEGWRRDRDIIGKIAGAATPHIGENLFQIQHPGRDVVPKGMYCLCSLHRGHYGKWDWTTLMTARNLVCRTEVPERQWNVFVFPDRGSCVRFIKWLNTDFVQFVVKFYKHSSKNPRTLLERIPLPPEDGGFSDGSLMVAFGLSEAEMAHIHGSMEGYGWKTRDGGRLVSEFAGTGLVPPETGPDGSEGGLMEFIDGINGID